MPGALACARLDSVERVHRSGCVRTSTSAHHGDQTVAHRAFTLIELLVVIAIVALLLGILLPGLAGARQAARTLKCLHAIKSLEQAHTMYYDANNGRFVDAGLAHGGVGDPRRSWPVALADFMGAEVVLRSPGDTSPFWATEEGGDFDGYTFKEYLSAYTANPAAPPRDRPIARWTSYGLNNYVTRSKHPPREFMERDRYDDIARIPRPFATVHFLLMTEGHDGSSFARSDHVHAEGWSDAGPDNAPGVAAREMELNAWGGPARNAGGTANYGFLDGHAETLRFRNVYRTYLDNRFYPEVAR